MLFRKLQKSSKAKTSARSANVLLPRTTLINWSKWLRFVPKLTRNWIQDMNLTKAPANKIISHKTSRPAKICLHLQILSRVVTPSHPTSSSRRLHQVSPSSLYRSGRPRSLLASVTPHLLKKMLSRSRLSQRNKIRRIHQQVRQAPKSTQPSSQWMRVFWRRETSSSATSRITSPKTMSCHRRHWSSTNS